MAKDNQIQLLPGKNRHVITSLKAEKAKKSKLFISGIIGLAIILLAGFYLSYLNSNLEQEITRIDLELSNLEARRDKKFENEALVLKNQMSLVFNSINNHTYWTKALAVIEDLMQDRIRLKTLQAEAAANEISITGVAANYSTVAKQLASFLAVDSIQDAALQQVKTENSGLIEFGITLKINPNLIRKNEQK